MKPLIALSLVGLVTLTGCAEQTVLLDNPGDTSHPAARTFEGHGISFQYPGGWIRFEQATPSPSPGQPVQPEAQSVDRVGVDDLNFVQIRYGVSGLPTEDFARWSGMVLADLDEQRAAHRLNLVGGPEEVRAAGFRALRYDSTQNSGVGYVLHVTWVGFVRGTTQFIIECVSLPQHATEIAQGCDQVVSTLRID